jgi:transposase
MPTVVEPWARRTLRLAAAQRTIGLALGGAAGARLATALTMPSARDTLLSLVRRTVVRCSSAPTKVGIDDWAWRKGQTYATILIDLDTHRPLALLPDRSPACVAGWLRAHPGITVVSRDRWQGYAEGITQGAPTAIQVADRFHLLQNLGTTLLRVLQQHQRAIERHLKTAQGATAEGVAESTTMPASAPACRMVRRAREQAERTAIWRARVAEAHQLHAQGWLQRAIAAHLGLHPRTIRRYLRQDPTTAQRIRRRRQRLLDPYQAYLVERWNAGCRTAVQLFREIQAQGYQGQLTTLRDYLAELRHAQGIPPYARALPPGITPVISPRKAPTVRQLAGLMVKPSSSHDADARAVLAEVRQVHPDLDRVVTLAQDFATMVRERQAERLDAWLEHATASGIAALRNFAMGRQDAAAVNAALRLRYSNGPTEGQINRLKLLKRQGYGRAQLDLLECRLLAQ